MPERKNSLPANGPVFGEPSKEERTLNCCGVKDGGRLLYFIYLVVTSFGLGYKTVLILLYAIGILLTFLFNRRWTFDHHGLVHKPFIFYISVYGLDYIFNLAALSLFAGEFGFPHQLVQGI